MSFDVREFPVDAQSVWHSGPYTQFEGSWFQYQMVYRGGTQQIRLYSANVVDLPNGFAPLPNPTRAQAERYSGFRDIPPSQAGAFIDVDLLCVWKDLTWTVCGVTAPRDGDLRLQLANTVPDDYPNPQTTVTDEILARWPGVQVGWEPNQVQALIRPIEATWVRLDVTAFDSERKAWADDGRASWWRASLAGSPFAPRDWAIEAVRRYVAAERIALGDYRLDLLEASRVRDGWRVWCPPPPVEGPGDLRFGWAVFYVSDDGIVVRSSTQESVADAGQRLSNGLLQRLLAGRRIASSGPGGRDFMPTVLDPRVQG